MTKKQTIQLFEEKKVRTVWDDEQEMWYFAIVDVVEVFSVAKAARKQLEGKLGRSVISSAKATDYLLPADDNDEE